MPKNNVCGIEDCNKLTLNYARLCQMHKARKERNGDPNVTKQTPNGESMAFVHRHLPTMTEDACFTDWPYYRSGSDKRPYLSVNGKDVSVARYAWSLVNGAFPKQRLLHLCNDKDCWNPHHMYEGSALDNVHDAMDCGTAHFYFRDGWKAEDNA